MIPVYKEIYIDNQLCLIWDNILPDTYDFTFIIPLPQYILNWLPEVYKNTPKGYCVKFLKVYNNDGDIDFFRIYRPIVETKGGYAYGPLLEINTGSFHYNE